MICYRPFQNRDPPGLAEIWRSQPPIRGRMQAVTASLLEELVFARPYFDRQGLIVAEDEGRLVGFVHAGFGADGELAGVDSSLGTTCMLLVAPHERRKEIEGELLTASEAYLRGKGAQRLFGGCAFPVNPFYLGLYGSSDLPGVLADDLELASLFRRNGYRESARRHLLHRTLATFRPPVDRRLMALRRRCEVTPVHAVSPDNWWESVVWMNAELTRYELRFRDSEEVLISATFWDVLPLAKMWGVQTMGLARLDDTPETRSEGITTLLLTEALLEMQRHSVALLEVQADAKDDALLAVFKELGLAVYDEGALFAKD